MKRSETILFAALGLLYFGYLCARAWCSPLTIDEGATWFNHVPRSLYDLFMYTDPVPNNHILNTLGIKIVTSFLPVHQFTVRIPSLVGAVFYIVGAIGIARELSRETWVRAFTVLILLAMPYVADFLALARGYGMACGYLLFSMWQAMVFFRKNDKRSLIFALVGAFLAMLASFTTLNFYLSFFGFLLLVFFQKNGFSKKTGQHAGILVGATTLLAAVCYTPFKRMSETDQFVFWAKSSFFKETIQPGAYGFLMGNRVLGEATVDATIAIFLILFGLWTVAAVFKFLKNKFQLAENGLFAWAMLAGTVLMTILQAALLDIPYLTSRTALIFHPLLALTLPVCLVWALPRWPKLARTVAAVVAIAWAFNFFRAAHLRAPFEWAFDGSTFEVLDELKKIHQAEKRTEKMSLHCRWIFNNSLSFAIKNQYSNFIEPMPWVSAPDSNSTAEFYYTTPEDLPVLLTRFDTLRVLVPGHRILLRKKF